MNSIEIFELVLAELSNKEFELKKVSEQCVFVYKHGESVCEIIAEPKDVQLRLSDDEDPSYVVKLLSERFIVKHYGFGDEDISKNYISLIPKKINEEESVEEEE